MKFSLSLARQRRTVSLREMFTPLPRRPFGLAVVPAVWLLLLAAAQSGLECRGGELVTHTQDYTIQNWQLEQGLPQISVTSLAQTPDGYLWVGTFNGLARFDGVRFTVFTEGNTPALGSSAVTHLQVDGDGALWVLTVRGGLVRVAAGRFTTVFKEGGRMLLGDLNVTNGSSRGVLLLDRQGQWRQLASGEVRPLGDRYATNDAPVFLFENSCLAWAACAGKISPLDRAPRPVFPRQAGESNQVGLAVYSAGCSQAGGYWVAGSNGFFRAIQGQLSGCVAPLPGETTPYTVQEDGQGTLWVGQWGQGLFRLTAEGTWWRFGAGSGMADKNVNCLFRDREGNLWVGTGQSGLYRFRPRVFRMYETESGPRVIMGMTQDREGRMWFAVNGSGLVTLADGQLKPVVEPAVLRAYPLAYSVLADRVGAVWIGLYGQKALRWEGNAVAAHNFIEGATQPVTPAAIFEDRSGTIWMGCGPFLFRYEEGRFVRLGAWEGLSTDPVIALAEDRSGSLYIGTDGSGLFVLRGGRMTHLTERDGLGDNHLTSLYVDDGDDLWIGSLDGGLIRYRHGQFHAVGLKEGLPTLTIGRMLEDGTGNLWLGSNRGILRVQRLALNEYLDGKRPSVSWDVFGLSDGLSTIGCAGASQPAVCRAKDGKLWFATIKGVAVVDPTRIPLNRLPPPVTIEEVVLDDQVRANPGPGIVVPPGTHRIEVRYTGLSLAAAEKVRFRYRLEPFDRDWIEAGTRRIAYYSAVQPGRYRFQVSACNNDGVWNEAGAMLGMVVEPPWWMAWWFRSLVVLGVAGLVFGWYERRVRRLRRERLAQEQFARRLIASQESERQRIAGELHDGMGQDLLVVANLAQLTLSGGVSPPSAATRLADIAETAKHALQQARRMAHNLRPGLLEELGFTEAVQASAEKAAQSAGISLKLDLANIDGLLPPEFEVNLFRIVQEALNNVLKHAGASEVKITLTHPETTLRLVVEDNGRGFDPSLLASVSSSQRGLGIRQLSERARMMGGWADLRSRPGQGTRLTVEVPWQPG